MTEIWAHRGASAKAPENTLPAFELAFELGADGAELDVQRTKDGVLVVCHDETIERVSNGSGAIAEHTYAELLQLDFSAGKPGFANTKLPTLAQVLQLIMGTDKVINIELKNSVERYPGMEGEVVQLVSELELAGQIWYSTFNHESLLELASSNSPRGALYVEQLIRPVEYVHSIGVQAMHPYSKAVRTEHVEQAHELGLRVHPWTVNSAADLAEQVEFGVDAVITNHPDLAAQVLGR